MNVVFIVGVVFLIYSTDNVKAEFNAGTENLANLMNAVYKHRIADIITEASRQDQLHVQDYLNGTGLPHRIPTQGRLQAKTNASKAFLQGKQLCPIIPLELVGNISDVNLTMPMNIDDLIAEHADVLNGGEWAPLDCVARHRVAFVIPYRDRWSHLKSLLHHLIPVLKRQQIHFRIFVVEQYGKDIFNKGRIMNAAFREALKLFDFHCVTFHDVDLVPEDDRNIYSCVEMPKHMSVGIDKFDYRLTYDQLVGGVLMFRTEHFQQVNGYSNMYWGWGGEDDDMYRRIWHQRLRVHRPPTNVARYKMIKHDTRELSKNRRELMKTAAIRSKTDGLNSIQYDLLFTHTEKLFTHFLVDIGHFEDTDQLDDSQIFDFY
ncbi:beta-1,4-galactosyltransferase 1 [Elysia marginata]|uniref:Beta-1,4-galactosyltransferase n=1 Tax=Elysia marginata TaxID=1093978 RepID=A0AAV4GNR5_9GAST|nr:beta-1,4-galactosyltransferase 1 [Elysia marginata]